MARDQVSQGLKLILAGIEVLQRSFEHRKFTIDGRLVGDIGEIIAEAEFDLELDEISRSVHDAYSGDRKVQIKATFKEHLHIRGIPEYLIGLKLHWDGTHEVVFNGPGSALISEFGRRKGFGSTQVSLAIAKLRRISEGVPTAKRIKLRQRTS